MRRPAPCENCARNLGDRCMAMLRWEPHCWAYQPSHAVVLADLHACQRYTVTKRGDADALTDIMRQINLVRLQSKYPRPANSKEVSS